MVASFDNSKQIRLLLIDPLTMEHESIEPLLAASRAPAFEVVSAETLDRAIALLESSQFDIVLLDLALKASGETAIVEKIVTLYPDTPLVVVAQFEDDQMALHALHAGAEDFVLRGEWTALSRTLTYAIERHESRREMAVLTRQLKLANSSLEKLSVIDPLTELLNRRGLQQALMTEVKALLVEKKEVLIVLLDIDDFRKINDRLGHSVGDIALKEVARKVRNAVRGIDYVSRIGGDEFIFLLPKAHPAEVVRISERLRLSVSTLVMQAGAESLSVTASLGAMMLSGDTFALDEILGKLYIVLRRSKVAGGNRVSYEGSEFDDTAERMHKQSDMVTRLSRGDNLFTARQSIVDMVHQQVIGYEFLSRFGNPAEESPDNFFRISAEQNALTLVDRRCLRAAFESSRGVDPSLCRHVNIYPSTLLSIPADQLLSSLPDDAEPGNFCFEISEAQIIGDPAYLLDCVRELRAGGVKIAIDDVGFGTSCLESLVILEPDVIKLDKRCVKNLASSPDKQRQLRRFLTVASSLASQVVVEGIENKEDLDAALNAGVRYAQGFYWGMPEIILDRPGKVTL